MIRYLIIAISTMVLLSGCSTAEVVKEENIPAYPIEILKRYNEGAISIVIPLHLHDKQLRILSYNADGLLSRQAFDDITFPVQIWIIDNEPDVQVFLARSPNSACILQWHKEEQQFYDGCLGTTFSRDGKYLDGPLSRNLDELPISVEKKMIWLSNQIIYGQPTKQQSK